MSFAPRPMDVDKQWSENEMQLIDEWITYGQQIVDIGNELKKRGASSLKFPKLPKQHIKDLLDGVKSKKKPRLSGFELHRYLISKLVNGHANAMPTLLFLGVDSTLDDVLVHLKSGYEYIKQRNSQILGDFIDYGAWLNTAYIKFWKIKSTGCIKLSWATWLADNVGITDSYARKLRVIANLFERYPKMRKLGIPMSELYDLKTEISELLTSNVDNCTTYWKGV